MTRSIFLLVCLVAYPLIYLLPQYGSTLMMTSLFIVGSTTTFTLIHLGVYGMLVYSAARWGIYIGRDWLWALPTVAMLFEFLPLLNQVTFMPSVLLGVLFSIAMMSPNLLQEQKLKNAQSARWASSELARVRQEKAFWAARAPGVGLSVAKAIEDGNLVEANKSSAP